MKTSPSWIKDLGRELRRLRTSAGISQADLAEKVEVSRFSINKYESGESAPAIETLARICEFLGTTSFVIYGQRFEIERDKNLRRPRSVPKQLRLKLGIVCTTDQAKFVLPLNKKGNRLDVEILSA